MIVIGLTGSIGMGKSTIASQLAKFGAKICCADAIVHALMAHGGAAVPEIEKHFPKAVKAGAVDRKALGEIVFKDKQKLHVLEQILHPLVIAEENAFIQKQARKGAKMIVLDIPLLFETGGEKRCDFTLVATAPHFIQAQRVMKRPGMTRKKFANILRSQMPDRKKRELADQIVQTGLGKGYSFRSLATLMHTYKKESL